MYNQLYILHINGLWDSIMIRMALQSSTETPARNPLEPERQGKMTEVHWMVLSLKMSWGFTELWVEAY